LRCPSVLGKLIGMSLVDRWAHNLSELRSQARYRALRLPNGIDLCSNDYLGYAGRAGRENEAVHDPVLAQRSATAARLIRGHHPIWEELEAALAGWHGAEASLMMNSGYAANEGLLSTIVGPHDWVASDQFNHASIIDGLRLSRAERFVYRHADLNHIEEGVRQAASRRESGRALFIVTESLFGMDGDIAPLSDIVELADRYQAHVVVDEAHATGCYGGTGSGLVDALGLRRRVTATVHTGGKALAVAGAYICGSSLLRELLINRCRHFMFSTALPPAVGAWWKRALLRVQPDAAARAALEQAARTFRASLRRLGINAAGTEYIVPVIVGDEARAERVAERLYRQGWDIRSIRPPTVPPGTARLRISIHADHPPAMLEQVSAGLAAALRESADG
jgi:8-amino-7-oxononanoate synthase